jgi:cytochrome P450
LKRQLRLLKNDPSLMANAIEELLRYDSSVQVTGRTTQEDVDEIGGIRLEKGQSVVCLLGRRDSSAIEEIDTSHEMRLAMIPVQ